MNLKFLLDENIPQSVYLSLKNSGYDVLSICEKFRGISDIEIIKISRENKRIPLLYICSTCEKKKFQFRDKANETRNVNCYDLNNLTELLKTKLKNE